MCIDTDSGKCILGCTQPQTDPHLIGLRKIAKNNPRGTNVVAMFSLSGNLFTSCNPMIIDDTRRHASTTKTRFSYKVSGDRKYQNNENMALH